MKKFLAVLLSVMMLISLAACGSTSETTATTEAATTETKKIDWPKKDITIMCPNAAGGPMDLSTRLGAKYLEKYLGVTVTVSNVTGGNNWTAWGQAITQGADGYTLAFVNFPNQFNFLLNKDIPYGNKDFSYIANVVHDPNVMIVSEKYHSEIKTLDDLIKLGKERDDLVIGTGGSIGCDDDILIEKINAAFGTKFISGLNGNSTNAYNAMLGGNVIATVGNCSEVYSKYQDKSVPETAINVLAIFDTVRSDLLPDIPTCKEATGTELSGSSDRGLAASAKLDPAIREILIDTFKSISEDPDFKADVQAQGMEGRVILGDEYKAVADQGVADYKKYYGDKIVNG